MVEIYKPETEDQVRELVAWAAAEETPLEILGRGTKRGLGRPVETDHVLDLSGLSGIVLYEPAELVMSARPGTPLAEIDAALAETDRRTPIDPPVPAGSDPGGVTVALIDTGVDYRLPTISRALARDAGGAILGYDYWDMDPRPFDADPARSPFFPRRHGTRVASVLLREGGAIRLIPYRYPRPDPTRWRTLVDDAAAKGARIVVMAMSSNRAEPWAEFVAAMKAHPEVLFIVSAGNDGRDLDRRPVYPATLNLDNMIAVGSADPLGAPAPGSNWGRRTVDLLVPGENLAVTDFAGRPARASGASFATPRLGALAARLLARNPDWDAARLKAAIFSRARMTDAGGPPTSRYGFLDPEG